MSRSMKVNVRAEQPSWSFGLFVAACLWLLGSQFVDPLNPFLLIGVLVLSLMIDGPAKKGVYIDK